MVKTFQTPLLILNDLPAANLPNCERRVSVVATTGFWLDASVGPKGQIAFTGSEPSRPADLYYLASPDSRPVRLTDFQREIAALELGKPESITWDGPDGLKMDGVLTYPPGFDAARKYPLVLYIHGGPRSASKQAFHPARNCWPPRAGWYLSPTIAAATIWAMRFKPPSGTTPARDRAAT